MPAAMLVLVVAALAQPDSSFRRRPMSLRSVGLLGLSGALTQGVSGFLFIISLADLGALSANFGQSLPGAEAAGHRLDGEDRVAIVIGTREGQLELERFQVCRDASGLAPRFAQGLGIVRLPSQLQESGGIVQARLERRNVFDSPLYF